MNSVLLSNEVLLILFSEATIFLILLMALKISVAIYRGWNFELSTQKQYTLEKQNYLTNTAIYFILIVKFILLLFFTYTIDKLSHIVPGAMCGAGVIGANGYGMAIVGFKLFTLFLSICWLVIDKIDIASNYIYFKKKYLLFFVIALFLIADFALQLLYFSNISLDDPVACCSIIYGVQSSSATLPFGLDNTMLVVVFVLSFILVCAALILRYDLLSFVFGLLYLFFGYYFALFVVGIYIYELPTHICPFCMLQKEYFFIGYALWGSLFLGSMFALSPFVLGLFSHLKFDRGYFLAIAFNLIFAIITLWYVMGYWIKNGVWL